jgi:hypothetical protein
LSGVQAAPTIAWPSGRLTQGRVAGLNDLSAFVGELFSPLAGIALPVVLAFVVRALGERRTVGLLQRLDHPIAIGWLQ